MTSMENDSSKKLKPQAEIEIFNKGPVRIKGNFIIRDIKRDIMETISEEIYLCRCGRSKSKPYCDGSHEK